MNEQTARQAQQNALTVRAAENAVATDVKEGVVKALTTTIPNQFAMTFEAEVNGKKTVVPYVKKAGRSVILNEVAKKKGGIAKLYSICIRSAQETQDGILKILAALPTGLQANFLQSRNNDTRALTLPDGWALYKFVILFKNGERWEGEGLASMKNVRMTSLHNRLDEMAETRAFMRCVGRGTADGFISPEQAAGGADMDPAEAELLAEEEAAEQDFIDVTEGGPEGESFRSPDGAGEGGTPGEPIDAGRPEEAHRAEAADGAGTSGAPADASLQGGGGDIRPHGSTGDGEADITIDTLMKVAKERRVFLKQFVKEQFGLESFGAMTADQRSACYLALLDL